MSAPPDPFAAFREMAAFLGGDPLASRCANGLLKIDVRTPEQLAATPLDTIRDIRQLGTKCVERIISCKEKLTVQPTVQPPADNELHYGRIAQYLWTLGRGVMELSHQKNHQLTVAERVHVSQELSRLALWYKQEQGGRERNGQAEAVAG